MPRTTWTQRGAAGICLVSLGTIGFLAGSSYSSVEVASRAMETMDTPVRDIAGQSLAGTGSAGFVTRSKAANYESDSRDFSLQLGVDSFCGPDGDFESCSVAYIGGGGSGSPEACPGLWATSVAGIPGSTQPSISTANPNGGTNHLHFEFDPTGGQGDAARNWAFSFDLPAIGTGPNPGGVPDWAFPLGTITRLSLDVFISATGAQNTFAIQPQAGDEGLLTTICQFAGSGNLVVGDTDATAPDGSFFIVTTDAVWEPGSYKTVEIYVDNSFNAGDPDFPGRIVYVYDGLTFWSTGTGQGGLGGGVFAGTQMQEVLLQWDANLDDGVSVDVDNVCIEQVLAVPVLNGACCAEDPGMAGSVLCTVGTGAECATAGGTYAGDTIGCAAGCPDRIECLDGVGDCFTVHATPGCNDLACCDAVCFASPFCCDVEWDSDCVAAASTSCPPPTACPAKADETGATGTCQDFSETNASTSLLGLFQVADDFVAEATGNITQVCFWGAYLPAESTDDFRITYYDCVDGLPGEVIDTFGTGGLGGITLLSRQDTEFQVAGTAPIFEYVYSHLGVAVTAGEKYFIEIQNNTPDADMDGVGDTNWFWEWADAGTSPNANGIGFQSGDDGTEPMVGDPGTYARFERDVNDYAFCLNIVTSLQDGTCELPPAEPCELDLTGSTDTEAEFCNEDPDQNLGCSAAAGPFVFSDISVSTDPENPTLIQGISWADGGTRDIDWYRMTAPAASDVDGDLTVTVCTAIASELPMAAVLIIEDESDGECGTTTAFGADAVGFDCGASLAIGYALSVDDGLGTAQDTQFFMLARSADGGELFEGAPCGGDGVTTLGNDYLLEIAVTDLFEDCFPVDVLPFCGPTDIDMDLDVGFNDLLLILSNWDCVANNNCQLPIAQLDVEAAPDGECGFADLLAVLSDWGPCQLP